LHVLQLQLSPPLPSPLLQKTLANPGSPGKWPLKRRERERERERERVHQACVTLLQPYEVVTTRI